MAFFGPSLARAFFCFFLLLSPFGVLSPTDERNEIIRRTNRILTQIEGICVREKTKLLLNLRKWALKLYSKDFFINLFIDALSDEKRAPRAAQALLNVGKPTIEPLITALHNENVRVRIYAMSILGQIGDTNAIEPLIQALREDKECAGYAAKALERIGEPAIEPLIATLGNNDKRVRYTAAGVLKGIGELTVEPLIAALQNENEQVRMLAAAVLKEIGELSVEPLIAALRNENGQVRMLVLLVLGEIKDARAVKPLIAILRDGNEEPRIRIRATTVLGKMGKPAVDPLLTILSDNKENKLAQSIAVSALGRIGDPRAVEPLVAMLDSEDEGVLIN